MKRTRVAKALSGMLALSIATAPLVVFAQDSARMQVAAAIGAERTLPPKTDPKTTTKSAATDTTKTTPAAGKPAEPEESTGLSSTTIWIGLGVAALLAAAAGGGSSGGSSTQH